MQHGARPHALRGPRPAAVARSTGSGGDGDAGARRASERAQARANARRSRSAAGMAARRIAVLLLALSLPCADARAARAAQRGRMFVSGLRGRHPQGAGNQRDQRLRPPGLGFRRRPQDPRAQAQDRPFPAGRRSTSTTPTSSAPGRRWCTAASGRWSTTSTGPAAGSPMEEASDWLSKVRKSPQALLYRGTNVYGTLFQEDTSSCSRPCCGSRTTPDKLPLPIRLRKETVERWREENEIYKIELSSQRSSRSWATRWCRSIAARRGRTSSTPAISRRVGCRSRRRRCSTRTSPRT